MTSATTIEPSAPARHPVEVDPDDDDAGRAPATGVPRLDVEVTLTRVCITLTFALVLAFIGSLLEWLMVAPEARTTGVLVAQVIFVVCGGTLLFGNLASQAARLGYLRRCQDTAGRRSTDLAAHDGHPPDLTVLVPSYQESPESVRMALLSAALQPCPGLRVVLLIDDVPEPSDAQRARTLEATRRLPGELQRLLDALAGRIDAARSDLERRAAPSLDRVAATRRLASLWDDAAAWLEAQAGVDGTDDHVERFFVREVLRAPAASHRATAERLRWRAVHDPLDRATLARAYRRLHAIFDVELAAFERKRYANLSHAPNKAMNLNSYIGLLGRAFKVVEVDGQRRLEPHEGTDRAPADSSSLAVRHGSLEIRYDASPHVRADHLDVPDTDHVEVPDADYLVVLDADSMLLPGYLTELVHVMEEPGNERVALAQTPYSAFPDPPGLLERVAGATTDVMRRYHQGTSRYEAAYWVGANAVVRTAALRDIAESDEHDDGLIVRFIQDRTLTEDTESTIDLVRRGWQVCNHPARLAYSATPPDFGSLLIQRRRWANGGLLILPKLVRLAARRGEQRIPLPELALRFHYLVSIAAVNVAFLVLIAFPFEDVHAPRWLPLLAVIYFGLYARDLGQVGYRAIDVVRVYALTLLLIPVNLGGALTSIRQALTGRRSAFGSTPNVPSRTPVPAKYLAAVLVLLVHWTFVVLGDVAAGRAGRATFVTVNVVLLVYAIGRFIGWRAFVCDLLEPALGPARATAVVDAVRNAVAGPPRTGHSRWPRPRVVVAACVLLPVVAMAVPPVLAHVFVGRADVTDLSGASTSSRVNLLVAGTDSRERFDEDERQEFSLGDFEGARPDTIFVLSVEEDRAALLSFPRDLYVPRCDGTVGRINEASRIGGPQCLVDTVVGVSGVRIDHYVQLDLRGLVQMVDAVGGVPVDLDEPITDDRAGANLPAGPQRLDGRDALAFARVRGIDSDRGRIGRQQQLLDALVADVHERGILRRPGSMLRLATAGVRALDVDRDMGPIDMVRLGMAVSTATEGGLTSYVVPAEGHRVDGQHVLIPDDADAAELFEAFNEGTALRLDAGGTETPQARSSR